MQTFPKPLSHEEETSCLQRYQAGDLKARDLLIEHNLRLVAHIAKKYQNTDIDPDDLISTGIIGLIKAVMTFDCGKNNRLGTYAARCIENELLMLMRANRKLSREVSMYDKIGVDGEGRELSLMDVLESPPVDVLGNLELQRNTVKLRRKMAEVLNDREKEILILRYGLGTEDELTQREIAERLGISRSYVSRIEKNALKKMKTAMT